MRSFTIRGGFILLFVAITSALRRALIPVHFSTLAMVYSWVITAMIGAGWLYFSWRALQRRDMARAAKIQDGTLWDGEPVDMTNVPPDEREEFRPYFNANENVRGMIRAHKIAFLKKTVGEWFIMALLIALALFLNFYHPAKPAALAPLHVHKGNFSQVSSQETHYIGKEVSHGAQTAIYEVMNVLHEFAWIPGWIALFFFYEGLAHWQRWKWSVWAWSDRRFIQITLQSIWMPWLGPKSAPTPMHQIVGYEIPEATKDNAATGAATIILYKQFATHMDTESTIVMEPVANYYEVERQIQKVIRALGDNPELVLAVAPAQAEAGLPIRPPHH